MADTNTIKRLTRRTLSGQIAEEIRQAILSGVFPLGSQLNEMELAEKFGVSRGPVREALQRLIQEALLVSEPHRGVFVPELNDRDLSDIFFVREAIEGSAIRRVMKSEALPEVSLTLKRLAVRMYATVQAETKLCLLMLRGGYRGSAALVEEHRRLADIIASGNVAAAVDELPKHFGDPVRIMHKANAARERGSSSEAA
jgi:DNA-binding GntR family transcriptional regulator